MRGVKKMAERRQRANRMSVSQDGRKSCFRRTMTYDFESYRLRCAGFFTGWQ